MSERRHTDIDRQESAGSTDCEPAEGYKKYFRFQPIRLYYSLCAEIERQGGPKRKREYCVNAIRRSVAAIRSSRWTKVAATVLLVAAMIASMGYFSLGKPNEAIALFTFVLTIVAAVQWWTTHSQLKLARDAIHQTDQVIELMRNEQRPWFIPGPPFIDTGNGATDLRLCVLHAHNSGRVPAIVGRIGFSAFVRPPGSDLISPLRGAWNTAKGKNIEMVISPEGQLKSYAKPHELSPEDIQRAVADYKSDFWVISVCEYTGPNGGDFAFECCFYYDHPHGVFVAHNVHNRVQVPPRGSRRRQRMN